MRSQIKPRYQGRITSWKDDQGFGFITPNGGGPEVFVHIKSFAGRGVRPEGEEIVTYHLTVNEKGQRRAENVSFVGHRAPIREASPPTTGRALAMAVAFLGVVTVCVIIGKVPLLILGLYSVTSVLTFGVYAYDKSAAQKGHQRTPEDHLHLLALIGGWPGALVAQQVFRHKTKKESFRSVFWVTVVANCGALGWLLTPSGSSALSSVLGAL